MSSTQRSWTIDPDLDGLDLDPDDYHHSVPLKKVPAGDIFEAARAGDLDRLRYLIDSGVNINARDAWDSVALYYACLAGHIDAARMLLENGAICSEHTFDGDRCHYAALNLSVRKLLKVFEARPPPLGALEGALRDTFLDCRANRVYPDEADNYNSLQNAGYASTNEGLNSYYFPPDVLFLVQGRPIEAHRAILSSRSPFFKKRFATKWKDRREIRFAGAKLSHPALYSFIHFFYSDRLEIVVDEIENLVEICKVCKCESLQKILEKEMILLKYAEYKALVEVDSSQKRFLLQGLSLPEEDRLSECLHQLLQVSLANSNQQNTLSVVNDERIGDNEDDLADVYVRVGYRKFRCHQVILASRSEYFKARLSRMANFLEGKDGVPCNSLPSIEEHDISIEGFEKMLEYMYTDRLKDIDPDQAEEMFDAASRYLMFPLKRAVADALLPHLEMESPAELCHWLILSDMYGVLKIREYCLDAIACNFESFADTTEFRAMLLTLPPPSGDSSMRTTLPSAPGANVDSANHGNLLDDLREKWLEAEAAELDKRDESAALFDKRLEMLMLVAERENTATNSGDT